MGGGSAPDAPETNYKRDIQQFVAGLKGSMGDVLGLEQKYRGKFQGLNLQDASKFLYGARGEPGLLALNRGLINKAGNQLDLARQSDIQSMTGMAGDVRGLLQNVSPESAAMVRAAQQNAIDAQKRAQGLTGQEKRSAQQFALESSQMQGREGDNSAIAGQLLNRENILAAKRQEASLATQNAYNMANSFYSTPGLQALSNTPQSYQAALGLGGLGLNAIGAGRPQLVDIGAGLNLGAADRQNQFNADSANSQISAQNRNTAISAGAAIGAAALIAMSDERVKTDKRKVGETKGGLPIYTYKMIGSNKTEMGVMAQDVKKKQPKASGQFANGLLGVDYSKIK